MNRFLAFAFVVAMTVATVLGVKLQQKTRDAEEEIRRMDREAATRVPVTRTDPRAVQEVRRLEGELQSLRAQLSDQREMANETLRVQIDLLQRENTALQTIISNQIVIAARMQQGASTVVRSEAEEPVVADEEIDPGIGLGVVGMNEFRLMRWRRGTLPTEGAAVIDVVPGGAASAAGVQLGDIITSMDGEPVNGAEMLDESLSGMAAGRVTTLVIDRDRSEVVVQLMIPFESAEE